MTIGAPVAGVSWTEWWEQLPTSWTAMELRRIADVSASNVDKISQEGEIAVRLCNYTDVYYHDVITPDLEFMEATATPSEIARFRLRGGEVLLTKDSETAEDIAIPAYVMTGLEDIVCGYHLYLLRPHPEVVDGRFLMRACSVSPIKDQFVTSANGITRFGLGQQDLGSSLVPVPPLHVQRNVADFLDRETAQIDHLIEQKQRLIELLEEKRAALITHAVTKGLDPDVEMKDSGVEWLGAIPANWAPIPLRHLSPKITVGIVVTPSKYYTKEGVPALRSLNVRPNGIDLKEIVYIGEDANRLHAKSILREGDLVTVRTGRPGTTVVVPRELDGVNAIDLIITRCPYEMVPKYLAHFMNSDVAKHQYLLGSGGAIQQHFNVEVAKRLTVLVPPLKEQNEIVATLSENLLRLNSLSDEILKATDLLREYRTALISAAVTGKIDVREEAA